MDTRQRKQTPGAREQREPREQERFAPTPEHDQDSEPPRTARAPGSDAIDEEWGRQEGC